MTYSLRDAARASMKSRLDKMTQTETGSSGTAVEEDYGNKAAGPSSIARYKKGGVVKPDADDVMAKRRPDRPHRASGGAVKGKTNVNIIIQPQGGSQGGGDKPVMPMPMPMPAPPPAPMADAPMGPPPGIPPQVLAALAAEKAGGAPMGPMPMRKRGGAVKMDAGAGSGDGRKEKIEKYGKPAK